MSTLALALLLFAMQQLCLVPPIRSSGFPYNDANYNDGLRDSDMLPICRAGAISHPETTAQVVKIVLNARLMGTSVKAFGRGHSKTEIMCPRNGGMAIVTDRLNAIHVDAGSNIVRVGGGATLEALTEKLIEHNLMITGLPDHGGISVAGAIATSAHGSSLMLSSTFADYLEGVVLVDGNAIVHRIGSSHPDFAAMSCNLGAFGIITEVTLRAQPLRKMFAHNYELNMSSFPNDIIQLARRHSFASVYYFSHSNVAIMRAGEFMDANVGGDGLRTTWRKSTNPISSVISTTAVNYALTGFINFLNRAHSPDIICYITSSRIKILKNPESTNEIGHVSRMLMGPFCNDNDCVVAPVENMDYAISLENLSNALQDITRIIKATKVCFPIYGIYIRFGTKSRKTLIGPTRDGDVAFLEIHIMQNLEGQPQLGSAAVDEIRQLLKFKYAGQPHFGKNFESDFKGLGTVLGDRGQLFMGLMQKYDPHALFKNKFLDTIINNYEGGVGTSGRSCAVTRTCYCLIDSDCHEGWACTNGSVYSKAKVCKKRNNYSCYRHDECVSRHCFVWTQTCAPAESYGALSFLWKKSNPH